MKKYRNGTQISLRISEELLAHMQYKIWEEEKAGRTLQRNDLIQFYVNRHFQLGLPYRKPESFIELRKPLDNSVSITLTDDSLEMLKQEAARVGDNVSAILRLCIYEGIYENQE